MSGVGFCVHQAYKQELQDAGGKRLVFCRKLSGACICQRYCAVKGKYVISEHAAQYCKTHENV